MKTKTRENYFRVFSIILCFFTSNLVLTLPYIFEFRLINGNWNWDGKIYGIICNIAMYFIFRKQFSENNFFTFKQNKVGLKSAIWTTILVVGVPTLLGVLGNLAGANTEFDIETLLFQISMPGIDEEILFRGVLLGLMCSSLRNGRSLALNPSIIINAVLFGLVHAWNYQNGVLDINIVSFIWTGTIGYGLAYITLKSRSILLAILAHNGSNFFKTLATMI